MGFLRSLALAALLAPLLAGPSVAADPERGRLLHGTFCLGCHGDSVAKRGNRVARSYAELRRQVARWHENTGARPEEAGARARDPDLRGCGQRSDARRGCAHTRPTSTFTSAARAGAKHTA